MSEDGPRQSDAACDAVRDGVRDGAKRRLWAKYDNLEKYCFNYLYQYNIMTGKQLRIVFMGTPEFAVPSLRRLMLWP